VSCALQDCIRLLLQRATIDEFADKFAIQLNDTHPALAVAELMRLLRRRARPVVGRRAGYITTKTFSYTNHTLLPEALETWSLPLIAAPLPRHLEIIFEINRALPRAGARALPRRRRARAARVDHRRGGERRVRMAHLATVGATP
jgi:starch phosphorylase